jgi:hypothetical protein
MLGTSLRGNLQATVAKKLVRRGDHGAAVKPLRRECRSDFGVPVLTCVRLFRLHARQWVRRAPGIPCALCFFKRDTGLQSSDAKIAARECGSASSITLSSRASEQSERDPGSITTGRCVGHAGATSHSKWTPVVMGPGSRFAWPGRQGGLRPAAMLSPPRPSRATEYFTACQACPDSPEKTLERAKRNAERRNI